MDKMYKTPIKIGKKIGKITAATLTTTILNLNSCDAPKKPTTDQTEIDQHNNHND
jgi:hypothetical protein